MKSCGSGIFGRGNIYVIVLRDVKQADWPMVLLGLAQLVIVTS